MGSKLTRRQLLRLAGAASVVGVPATLAAHLLIESQGVPPPKASEFAANSILPASEDAIRAAQVVVLSRLKQPADYSSFLGEILRAEGVLGFRELPLDQLAWRLLRAGQIVLLGEGLLTPAYEEMLRAHVVRGGGLVVMRPYPSTYDLLGVVQVAGETNNGYLIVDKHPITQGIDPGPLQFHAPAGHYRVRDTQVLAWLCDGLGHRSNYPAITMRRVGRGLVAMWAFDLARSIVYTRQGNPAWINQDRDGLEGIRATDMFSGWIDLDRIHIPQADEQQRLLVNILHEMGQHLDDAKPLPRLWYFPGQANSVLVVTGDSHTNPVGAIERVLQVIEQRNGTMSIYYTPPADKAPRRALHRLRSWLSQLPLVGERIDGDNTVSPYDAEMWRSRGHEFALHPHVEEGLEAGWHEYWARFTGLGLGHFETARTHRVLWHGWTDTAQMQARYGIGMNLDYYHVGPSFQRPDGHWAFGYFIGSGLPMRFTDLQGRLLNIYQQPTLLVDEQVLSVPWASNPAKLNVNSAVSIALRLIDQATKGAYAAIATQFHIDPIAIKGPWTEDLLQWMERILDYCVAKEIPIWSAQRWLKYTRARNSPSILELHWSSKQQILSIIIELHGDSARSQAKSFTLLLPSQHGAHHLATISVNENRITPQRRKVGAVEYLSVVLDQGRHHLVATYGPSQ